MKLNKALEANLLATVKDVHEDEESGKLTIEGFANTTSKDRMGDVIPSGAWKKPGALDNYKKNPIVLAFHNHSMPVGKCVDLEVRDNQGLYVKCEISSAEEKIYRLIKEGVLKTFSVGFMIKDAEYNSEMDTFLITEVELFEISVVSVPANQDSTFSVAKTLKNSGDFQELKKQFIHKDNGEDNMSIDLEKFQEQLLGKVSETASEAAKAQVAEAERLKKEAEEAERKRQEAEEARKAEMKKEAKKQAEDMVSTVKEAMEKENGDLQKLVDNHSETIKNLREEISQVVSAGRQAPVSKGVKRTLGNVDEKTVDEVVMVSMIKEMPIAETEIGQRALKAVNTSSSIEVSSEAYETEFSTNLIRDIQKRLVMAPLFSEIQMNSANLTVPINPDRKNASWVGSSDFGKKASSGNELEIALTEKTLRTFKLAAKTYLTEETDEDVIIAMAPILRDHLVEAHANEIDRAFLLGTGSNQPKGLVTQASAVTKNVEKTLAEATGENRTKITAKMILKGRRRLDRYGINRSELALVVSSDAYWDLLEDDEWSDVNQVSDSNATKLQGEVGNIYGLPVIVSDQFLEPASGEAFAVMVNRENFVVPRQRGATVRTDFDVESDSRVFVATQRLNLQPWIEETPNSGNGKGVVVYKYKDSAS